VAPEGPETSLANGEAVWVLTLWVNGRLSPVATRPADIPWQNHLVLAAARTWIQVGSIVVDREVKWSSKANCDCCFLQDGSI